MNSFISNFKPFILAALFIFGIEALLPFIVSIPQQYNTNLLALAPVEKEKITRIFITEKLNGLQHIPARFIQLGDSSSYYGIVPHDVMRQLKGGDVEANNWLNFGCCGISGFRGYRALFEQVSRTQPQAEYMVIAMTPYYSPKEEYETGNLAESIEDAANPYMPKFYSGGLRLSLTNYLYRGMWQDRFLESRTDTYWGKTITQLQQGFAKQPESLGWVIHPAEPIDVPTDACEFELEKTTGLNKIVFNEPDSLFLRELITSYKTATKLGYKFILVTNPVPCSSKNSSSANAFNNIITEFSKLYPDAIIPFKAIRIYPKSLFRDQWHLNEKGAHANSEEIGKALKPLLIDMN